MSGQSSTVLVVDDDDANRVTMERILTREKYRVLHADSGRAGMERLRVERARCITGAVLRAHPETESGQSRHAVEEAHAVSRADVVSRASPDVVWVPTGRA